MPRRYVVLASGGRDSTVLLHAMAELSPELSAPVVVLHFDHGLAATSVEWARGVGCSAEELGLAYFVERLELPPGGAAETRAREARYERLAAWMEAEDCCLSAHHGDDQAETFLLQALRGAGPAGLAGMPAHASFGRGWLARPLLEFTRDDLAAWARARGLSWIEDPANRDLEVPRNHLRHEVWPRITAHWPAAARTLARSARLAAQNAALVEEIAAEDLARLGAASADRLPIGALAELGPARRRALLRHWLAGRGFAPPTEAGLARLERGFIMRDPGARAVFSWPGAEGRRFRDMLHVFAPLPEAPAEPIPLSPGTCVELGALGRVGLVADRGGGLGPAAARDTLSLRFRGGGERLRPPGSVHRRTLKNLLQESSVLPWMRFRLPLLYVNGVLAAVGGVTIAAEFAGEGWTFAWEQAPPIQ